MKRLYRLWILAWLLFLALCSLVAAMEVGSYMVREYAAGVLWLAVLLGFFLLVLTVFAVRVAGIAAGLAMGWTTPRLAWRDLRSLVANMVFFAKTGWIK